MVCNKLLASFIYFFLFLNAEYSPDSDKGAATHPFDIPVWVHTCVEIKRRRADAGMEATSRVDGVSSTRRQADAITGTTSRRWRGASEI